MKDNNKPKSKKRRNFPIISELSEVYKIINKIQIKKKEYKVCLRDGNILPVLENNLKDLDMEYKISSYKKMPLVTIFPPPEQNLEEIDEEVFWFFSE